MAQVIVPLAAPDVDALRRRAAVARTAGADVIELRLDLCAAAGARPEALAEVCGDLGLPVLATCRWTGEGGAWETSEADRLALLLRADAAGAAFIDVELAAVERLPKRPERAGLVLSYHDFQGMGGDLEARVAAMVTAGCAVAKVAVTPTDAADLDILAALCARFGDWAPDRGENAPGLIALGMGEIGLPSRLLAGAWGCAYTFARLRDDGGTAPGQPTVEDLVELYRVRQQGAATCIFGVVGDPVGHSLSPTLHNRAFAHHRLDAVYVPFLAHDVLAFWRSCRAWIDGLSITIPHKSALVPAVDEVEELAASIGVINTVYRDPDGRAIGANTDAPAAVDCVAHQIGDLGGRVVLILGAGGVSRAMAAAFVQAGAQVYLHNRSHDKAQRLATEFACTALDRAAAEALAWDVLINGTSVGMNSDESPWPAELLRSGAVVFDTVYAPLDTRLLREAEERSCIAVCGLSMLVGQALGQYERWTGLEAPEGLMKRAALERLGVHGLRAASACTEDLRREREASNG